MRNPRNSTSLIGVAATLAAVLLLLALPSAASGAGSGPPSGDPAGETAAGQQFATYPLLAADKSARRSKPPRPTIHQFDAVPLGPRQPLLVVPGLDGEHWPLSQWHKLLSKFTRDDRFHRNYKVYVLRYDSSVSPRQSVPLVGRAIMSLHSKSGGTPITVLALSIGGNLVCQAMNDAGVDRAIRQVVTMGTPFHGSPLLTSDWYQYSLYKNLNWPWTRVEHSLIYRLYFHRHPNLVADYGWNNCDGLLPNPGRFRSLLPFGPSGHLTVASDTNERLTYVGNGAGIDKGKLIAYGGYLLNPYQTPKPYSYIRATVTWPYTLVRTTIPAHLANKRAVLRVLNREIARMATHPAARSPAARLPAYGLNDGVTPLTSSIFLPPPACRLVPLSREADIARASPFIDVGLARVFRNIDHLSYIVKDDRLEDQLHPDAGKRSMADWILGDLLRSPADEELVEETGSDHIPVEEKAPRQHAGARSPQPAF